jgi:hypothetical protein
MFAYLVKSRFRLMLFPFLLAVNLLQAQDPDSWVVFPAEPAGQDTLNFRLFSGTATNPWQDIDALEVIFGFENLKLLGQTDSTVFLDSTSFLLDAGQFGGSYQVDTQQQEVHFSVWRTNGGLRTGHGYVASGSGIIIVIEDVGKRFEPGLVIKSLRAHLKPTLPAKLLHDPSGQSWFVLRAPQARLRLLDLNGRSLWEAGFEVGTHRLSLPMLPTGAHFWQLCLPGQPWQSLGR